MIRAVKSLGLMIAIAAAFATITPAHASPQSAVASQHAVTDRADHAGSIAWSKLMDRQRRVLMPLEAVWPTLPGRRQQRLAARALRWSAFPAARQRRIRARLSAWVRMTPAERERFRQNARAFRALSKAERARIRNAYVRFETASPAERRRLRQRWRALPAAERFRWAANRGDRAEPVASEKPERAAANAAHPSDTPTGSANPSQI